ncbi:ion channel CASTOR-like isoform X3 [Rhododendron vialii]|uniref:ion channel CASTOR-like isoform X3 n=1 Tax=Rhododendron vialii TaxID=182163 RepID=UPI00265E4BDF|nr:ion channel CASTOR-like isoform X3 [Rhododendron vialii]
MSLDPDSSPPATSRDWLFQSPPLTHSAHHHRHSSTRSFSTNNLRRTRRTFVSDPKPSSFQTSPSLSVSAPMRDSRSFGGLRRRIEFDRGRSSGRYGGERDSGREVEVSSDSGGNTEEYGGVLGEKVAYGKKFDGFGGGRLKVRWQLGCLIAIFFTLSSLLHKNFSLHNQVIDLQDHISKLNVRLRACNLSDPVDIINSIPHDSVYLPNKSLKISALIVSLTILSLPFLFFKYFHHVLKSRRSPNNTAEEVSLNKQIAYRVDVFLSVHPYAKPMSLLVATLLLICLGGLALFGVTEDSLTDCLWLSWTYVADSGNHTNSEGIGPRLVSVSISFGGMLIFAMMLGLVSDAISEKLDSLRKGRSEVVEQNHTLILWWSDKLGSLLNQLSIANENWGGGIVVVMAERDKEEMELDIAKMEFDFRGTSVICRSGSPLILADLKKSDARALRTVLSLTGVKEGLRGHIVVELSDLDNEVLVKLVGGDLVETVVAHDVIGRLMIQCARQPGLAQIWADILGFENCEFYIKRWPQLDGMQFEDVLISFPDAIPCGVKVASYGGKIILNPDESYVLQEGDEILVIAEDDDTYSPSTFPTFWRGHLPKDFIVPKSSERILFCGWRRDMEDMIMVLDAFLAPGSELWMFNEVLENEREKKLIDGGLDITRLVNISIVNREGNAVIRRHLESLPLESFDSILILADESVEDSAMQADSRSLATLLLIRDIQAKRLPFREARVSQGHRGSSSPGSWIGDMQQASYKSVIISEILDPRTKNLLSMSKISDYVLSNELVSMALAMVAEDRQINDVLEELFAEEGNEMHIRQADLYIREGEELSFYEVLLRARQRREIVIGYRLANAEKAVINPPAKNEQRRWSVKDVFVVIAEKE